LKLIELFEQTGLMLEKEVSENNFGPCVIDSRNIKPGDTFVALQGEKADGNLYAEAALKNGAGLVVLDNKDIYDNLTGSKILVTDVQVAVKAVGSLKLQDFEGLKIAITGSVGKTSTKELFSSVFSKSRKTYVAQGNYNNDLGVSIVAANLDMTAEIAIFEFGTNSSGEIADLSRYVKPDVAVVTSVGHAHIGRFGSMDDLAKEKFSIAEGMNGGILWINSDAREYAEYFPMNVNVKFFGELDICNIRLTECRYSGGCFDYHVAINGEDHYFRLNHIYDHFVMNSLPVIGAAIDAGVDYEDINQGIREFSPVTGRGKLDVVGEIIIIDDTYNAGYEAVMSSIDNLANMAGGKFAVIGEMAEIEGYEEKLYGSLMEKIKDEDEIIYFLVGENYKKYASDEKNIMFFNDKDEALPTLMKINEGFVLFKASRSAGFETLIESFAKEKDSAV